MNFEEAVKFLKEYQPIGDTTCGYCGAGDSNTVPNILDKLMDCANCRVDIECAGKWTGYGIEALKKAYELDPENPGWARAFELIGLTESDD